MLLCIGRRFASPVKPGARSDRARSRDLQKFVKEHSVSRTPVSRSVTPTVSPMVTSPHEVDIDQQESSTETIVHTALLARIEMLESDNIQLKQKSKEKHFFRIEDIQDDDKKISFYTGFISYMVFSAFFEFLGPAVDNLNFWGSKERVSQRRRSRKLTPKNQLFHTLIKLKLNLKLKDLSFRFGISSSQTSRCITTWICFLYHHLREIDWMPTVSQVLGTFKEKFRTTYTIIDGSEVFIETPSDLHMQSSTWSQYKHHNTVKFLVACTPNGAMFRITCLCRINI